MAIPCRGDRYHANSSDEEIIFTIPRDKLKDVLAGLRHVCTVTPMPSRLPRKRDFEIEYPLLTVYDELGKRQGLGKKSRAGKRQSRKR